MPKGMVTAFFLNMKCTFECIVKRVFGCLDIYMTHKLGFTLNLESKFFTFFCTLRHCEQSAAILCFFRLPRFAHSRLHTSRIEGSIAPYFSNTCGPIL